MADYVFERVSSELDLDRCQGNNSDGQCWYKAIPGTRYCPRHGGNKTLEAEAKEELRNYRLTKYKARVADFANNPDIKSLREEIGITRMVLESILNHLDTPNDLLIYSDKLTSLVNQVRILIESCQKLEERNNKLLDRNIVMIIADNIISIVGHYIKDSNSLEEIGAKIANSIETAASTENSFRADS